MIFFLIGNVLSQGKNDSTIFWTKKLSKDNSVYFVMTVRTDDVRPVWKSDEEGENWNFYPRTSCL